MNLFYPLQDSTVNISVPESNSVPAIQTPAEINVTTQINNDSISEVTVRRDTLKRKIKPLTKTIQETSTFDTVKVDSTSQKKETYTPSWNSSEDIVNKLFVQDSLKTSVEADSSHIRKSNFLLKPKFSADWIFWLLMVILFLFLWVRLFYRKYFNMLIKSAVNYHASSKLFTEKNVLAKRVSMVLNFIYTITLGAFLYVFGDHFNIIPDEADQFNVFLIIFNLVILISIFKVIFHKIVGFIFKANTIVNEYIHNAYVINKTLGILLFPFTFAAIYSSGKTSDIMIISAAVILVLSLVMKFVRSSEIIIQNGIFNFYSILYLCTLEFLPVLIGYRFLKTLI